MGAVADYREAQHRAAAAVTLEARAASCRS
jgi:hypothetical protein